MSRRGALAAVCAVLAVGLIVALHLWNRGRAGTSDDVPGMDRDVVFASAPGSVGPATWSPDGSHLAVSAVEETPEVEGWSVPVTIWLIDASTGQRRRICTASSQVPPAFSPDGQQLLCVDISQKAIRAADLGAAAEVVAFDAPAPYTITGMAQSPVSGQLAVLLESRSESRIIEISDSGRAAKLVWSAGEGQLAGVLQYSQDGARLLWHVAGQEVVEPGLWLYDTAVAVATEIGWIQGYVQISEYAWRKDGRSFVFIQDPGDNPRITVADIPTRQVRSLAPAPDVMIGGAPVCSPTGDSLAFARWDAPLRDFAVFLTDAEGSDAHLMAALDGYLLRSLAFSPAGDRLAVSANGRVRVLAVSAL